MKAPEIEEAPREHEVMIKDEPAPQQPVVVENHEPEPEMEKPPAEEPVDAGKCLKFNIIYNIR